jgi:hypothetical protein
MGLRQFACWDCGFESSQWRGWMSLLNVVCCQVEVSAAGRSLVQRGPTECGVSGYDLEISTRRRPYPTTGCQAKGTNLLRLLAYKTERCFPKVCVVLFCTENNALTTSTTPCYTFPVYVLEFNALSNRFSYALRSKPVIIPALVSHTCTGQCAVKTMYRNN